jgi:DNA-directed RNA polymerase beta' subunit
MTNDVYEVYTRMGIEAAREVLLRELRLVLAGVPGGIDHRHVSLLGDTMTNRGFFMSIDRHGINHRGELGPLAKCSFEQTDAMLIKAGVFAERDKVNGVSANIMLGQLAPCGTGDCDVLLDNEYIEERANPVALDFVSATHPTMISITKQQQRRQQQHQQPRGMATVSEHDGEEDDDAPAPARLEMPMDEDNAQAPTNTGMMTTDDELQIV